MEETTTIKGVDFEEIVCVCVCVCVFLPCRLKHHLLTIHSFLSSPPAHFLATYFSIELTACMCVRPLSVFFLLLVTMSLYCVFPLMFKTFFIPPFPLLFDDFLDASIAQLQSCLMSNFSMEFTTSTLPISILHIDNLCQVLCFFLCTNNFIPSFSYHVSSTST